MASASAGNGGLLTVACIAALVVLLVKSSAVVRGNQFAIIERRWVGRAMPEGRVVALQREVGVQARILGPGVHFLIPFLYRVDTQSMLKIDEDKVGDAQRQAKERRKEMENTKAQADLQPNLVRSEVAVQIAAQRKQETITLAEGHGQATRLEQEGIAAGIAAVGHAEGEKARRFRNHALDHGACGWRRLGPARREHGAGGARGLGTTVPDLFAADLCLRAAARSCCCGRTGPHAGVSLPGYWRGEISAKRTRSVETRDGSAARCAQVGMGRFCRGIEF